MTTTEEIAERKAELLAKVLCRLEGIEPVDSMDGSYNWWLFKGLADEVVKKLAGQKSLASQPDLGPRWSKKS